MVAEVFEVPEFTAKKEGISPEPDAAKPMLGFEFVQLKIAPAGELEIVVARIELFVHVIISFT